MPPLSQRLPNTAYGAASGVLAGRGTGGRVSGPLRVGQLPFLKRGAEVGAKTRLRFELAAQIQTSWWGRRRRLEIVPDDALQNVQAVDQRSKPAHCMSGRIAGVELKSIRIG